MIEYRKINKSEINELRILANEVLNNLERKEFLMNLGETEINKMLDDNKIMYGAYDGEKLVGCAQLNMEKSKKLDNVKKLIDLDSDKVAKFGKYLVLNDYRNRGIMKNLEKLLIDEADRMQYKYIIILAHPENIPSNKAIINTGAKLVKTANFGEYLRNIYLLEL